MGRCGVHEFEDLVREASRAPIGTWDFRWLDGRAVEERPTWRYFDRVSERVAEVDSLLELQAGTGAMMSNLPVLPERVAATEGYPPSLELAAPRLRAVGASLVAVSDGHQQLPFRRSSFDLVVSRHPVAVWWAEIARVLRPGGTYFAQHVGPSSLGSLREFLVGSLPESSRRDPKVEMEAAESSGLVVRHLASERPRTAFFDIGAVVYFLRLVPWIVPDFSVDRYRQRLGELHEVIGRRGAFETTASRTLIEAVKPEL
jgi:SAM-dependent methyltransferase